MTYMLCHPSYSGEIELYQIRSGAATPHKTPTVRPPTPYHENYSSKMSQTCRTLLEKQGRTHKWCTLMDPPHMAVQKQDDQHEHTFRSYVRIRDVVLKTYLGRWTIGRSGERGSGISVLPARYDDDDEIRSPPSIDIRSSSNTDVLT